MALTHAEAGILRDIAALFRPVAVTRLGSVLCPARDMVSKWQVLLWLQGNLYEPWSKINVPVQPVAKLGPGTLDMDVSGDYAVATVPPTCGESLFWPKRAASYVNE